MAQATTESEAGSIRSFESKGDVTTRVELEHRGFERHGDDGGDYSAALASEQGWPYILGGYASPIR